MNTTNTSITLLDLEEFEEYSIAIAAATDAGIGPYSVDMVVTTSEAGKLCQHVLLSVWVSDQRRCSMLVL